MIFVVTFINSKTSSAGATNVSGTSPSSSTPNLDLALVMTADKAVKAILPFLKELSKDRWWTDLLAAWINFEAKGPPKLVCFFYIFSCYVLKYYYSDSLIAIVLVRFLYG